MSNNYSYSTFDSNYDTFRETDPIFPQNTRTRKLNTEPLIKLCETSANGIKSLIKYVSNKIYQRHNYEEVLKGVAAKNLTHRAESGIAEAKAPQIQS